MSLSFQWSWRNVCNALSIALLLVLPGISSSAKSLGSTSDNAQPIVVLITGCSSGIGKELAIQFAADKRYKVWATMRSIEKWDGPVGNNIEIAPLDVTSEDSVKRLVEQVIRVDEKVDILINNAGYGVSGCLEAVSVQEAQVMS
jgi:NAD(P)-dependent dehydrogenase (short-subunit alcohol dehydrogenase family)